MALCEEMPQQLILTGGTSRSQNFCQLFSDVLQAEIVLLKEQQNIGLRGVLASCGLLTKKTDQDDKQDKFLPNNNLDHHYNKKYAAFQQAYPRLEPIYSMLSDIPN
jgi:sugar (pentulose or hexulose) kinase